MLQISATIEMTEASSGRTMSNCTDSNCSGVVESKCNDTILPENNDQRDEYLANWELVTLAAMFVIAVAGNSLVITALYLRRHDTPKRRLARIYFFILHLSIADLLTALLNVLPQLAWEITFRYIHVPCNPKHEYLDNFLHCRRFQGGPILCKLVKFGQPLGPYLSSYVLTATALDRYQAVCHPLTYCSVTSRRSRLMVYIAWGLSLALCIPQVWDNDWKHTRNW